MEVRFESSIGNLIWHLPKSFSNALEEAPSELKLALLKMNGDILEKVCAFMLGLQRSTAFIGPKKASDFLEELTNFLNAIAVRALDELEKNKDNPPQFPS